MILPNLACQEPDKATRSRKVVEPRQGRRSEFATMTAIEDDWIEVTHLDYESKSIKKGLDPGLPRENPTPSSWLIPPDSLQNYRSTESLPTGLIDVVIIGSGFGGTSVAWHLLHGDSDSPRHSYLRTLMLEARDVCSGATGRNGIQSLYSG